MWAEHRVARKAVDTAWPERTVSLEQPRSEERVRKAMMKPVLRDLNPLPTKETLREYFVDTSY